jgi:hypothetical protein
VSNDRITIEIAAETREAIAALAKVAKATEQVEKETKKVTAAQRAWAAANTDLGKLAGGWKEAGESIAKVAATFGGLAAAGVLVAAQAERQEAALRRLGAAYDAVQVATNGAFSAQQALTLQGQIQAAGVRMNAQQLGLLTRAAREYAQATGNDASEAVEKLTNAIVNNSEDALSELNLAQARATTSTQTLANVTRALEERFRGVAPAARTLNEDLAKLPDVLTHIGNIATQAAAGGLTRLIDAFNGAGAAARTWRDIVELADTDRTLQRQAAATAEANRRSALREQIQRQAQAAGARFSTDDIQGLNTRQLESVSRRLEVGFGTRGRSAAGSDLGAAFSAILAQQDRGIDSTRAVGGIIAAVRDEEAQRARRAAMGEARPVSEGERIKETIAKNIQNATQGVVDVFESTAKRLALASGQMASEANDLALALVGANNALRNRFQTIGNALGLQGLDAAESADLFGSIADAQEGGGAAAREARARRSRIAARDQGTRRMVREQSLGGRVASGLGFRTDDEGRIANFDGMAAGAELLTGTVNSLTSGLSTLFDTLVSGSADAGTAFQLFASNLLSELGKMAMNKGLFYTFEGIAALFTAPPAAPAYLAAGAGLLALGAGLGIAGAATRPQVPAAGAGDASSARSLAPRATSGSGGSRGLSPVTVVLSSLVPAGPGDAQRLGRGLNDARRRGALRDTIPRRLEH